MKKLFSFSSSRKELTWPLLQTLIITIWVIIRNGLRISGPGELGLESLQLFPKARYYVSESFGPLIIGKIFQLNTWQRWSNFYLIITLLFMFFGIFLLISKLNKAGVLLSIVFSVSPIATTILAQVGHYDLFTIIGWLVYIVAFRINKKFLRIAGLTIAISGNPTQSLISIICLLLLSKVYECKTDLKILTKDFLYTLIFFGVVQSWLIYYEVSSRLLILPLYIAKSSTYLLQTFPNSIASMYGIFWIFIFYSVFIINDRNKKIQFSFSAVILPFLATTLAVDGTRVFACVSFPILLYLLQVNKNWNLLQKISKDELLRKLLIIAFLFYPLNFVLVGQFYQPYSELVQPLAKVVLNYDQWFYSVFNPVIDWYKS
jgi:hypothetical protein